MVFKPYRTVSGSLAVLALALVVSALPAAGSTAPTTVTSRAATADTLFPDQGNPGYQVRSYGVALRYAPGTNYLNAVATVRAHAPAPLRTFTLDLSGLRVGGVLVNGTRATWTRSGHKLTVIPASEVSGRFVTTIRYSGTPRRYTDADGSYEGWLRNADGATALGQPVGTMTWLPCNNTPGDKARFTFRITVPNTHQAVANGDLVKRRRRGGDTTWVWRAVEPMATQLATVAIGKFNIYHSTTTSITGRTIPIWNFVDPTTPITRRTRARLPKVLAFHERLFGPYPFSSTGMIVDDAAVGYALETQTRPFYPSRVLTRILVHEMAHQWYGDSVTVRDWHDIWLSEGFATYAEWLWNAAHGGRTPAEEFADLYALPAGNSLWHPAVLGFTDPADLFGTPVYDRGAMTLQALRVRVGDKSFFAILKGWAALHRHGNARSAGFVAYSEKVSGQQLDDLFYDWLVLDGKPTGY